MKLFTPIQVISNREKQASVDERRINTINTDIARKRQELEAIEIEFAETLNENHIIWRREENEYLAIIGDLKSEVDALEESKRIALLPITERQKELEAFSELLSAKDQYLEGLSDDLEGRMELVEEKLSQVAEREEKADRMAYLQSNAQKGIDMQREQVKQQSDSLKELVITNLASIREKEDAVAKEQTILQMQKRALEDKELELIKIEQSFADRERAIQDKYETLQRAIEHNKKI